MPVMIITAVMGLKAGKAVKMTLESIPMPQSTKRTTNSMGFGFLLSKLKRNGIMERTMINIEVI